MAKKGRKPLPSSVCACCGKHQLRVESNAWVFRVSLTPKNRGYEESKIDLVSELTGVVWDKGGEKWSRLLSGRFRRALRLSYASARVEYCKVAYEIGADGLHHIQGYLHFQTSSPRYCPSGNIVKSFLMSCCPGWGSIYVHYRKGTHSEADEYPGREEKSGFVLWVAAYGESSLVAGSDASGVAAPSKTDAVMELIDTRIQDGASKQDIWREFRGFMARNYRAVYEMEAVLYGRWLNPIPVQGIDRNVLGSLQPSSTSYN